ncbi:MAG: hypothetical protein V1851_02660 [Patescibacteria group bacterium]
MDETIKSILLILAGIGVVWIATGGPSRMESKNDLFIKPPVPLNTGETYGKVSFWNIFNRDSEQNISNLSEEEKMALDLKNAEEEAKKLQQELKDLEKAQNTSQYAGIVEINRSYGSKTNVDQEYIKLKVNKTTQQIPISGWTIKSRMTGNEVKIGQGIKVPYTSQINSKENIFVKEGDEIYITTGRSPIGFSFLVNKCSGYLEQFQDFYPNLNKQCPQLEDENLPLIGPNSFNDKCVSYIEKISLCETPTTFPIDMQPECQNFILNRASHNKCIDNHKNDSDFYKKEWRVYLNRSDELWKKSREIIELLDSEGKVVDTYNY